MKTLRGRLFLLVIATVLLCFLLAWFPLAGLVRERLHAKAASELDLHAQIIAAVVSEGPTDLIARLDTLQSLVQDRITVINSGGKVLYDSGITAERLDNHRDRPEIVRALTAGRGESVRYSRSLGADQLYVARRSEGPDGTVYVVRTAYSLASIDETLNLLRQRLLTALLLSGLLAAAVSLWISSRLVRPLKEIEEAARSLQEGGKARFPSDGPEEIATLASALKTMASRLKETLADLEAERQDLTLILENLPVGIIVTDPEGRLRFANNSIAPLLRDTPEKAQGRPCQGVLRVPDLTALIEETARSGRAEATFLVRDKSPLLFQSQAVKLQGGALVVVTDLTERHHLEEARKAFVADASHELQTPLTAIRTSAELILSSEDLSEAERHRYADAIIEQQERMTSLVDDLLLLSRLESGPPSEEEADLDLRSLLTALIGDTRYNPMAAAIDIESDLAAEAPFRGRPEEIRRALGNLVDNAVKYIHKRFGGARGGRLTLTLKPDQGEWALSVADNGIGLKDEDLPDLFERFQRGERDRGRIGFSQGGYGLGLAITKRIVEGHGGRIEAFRREEGALFTVHLPRP